ncbi:MAG: hypothetical protein AAFZ09_07650 [Pseudomonadota bacterium]
MPAYIRPLFCEGKGPFRWVALSGDPEDIAKTDAKVRELIERDGEAQERIATLQAELDAALTMQDKDRARISGLQLEINRSVAEQKRSRDLYQFGSAAQTSVDVFTEDYGGGDGFRYQLRNLVIAGQSTSAIVERGGPVAAEVQVNHDCPSCGTAINQVLVGLAGEDQAQACIWNGLQSSGGWTTVTFGLDIPLSPGTYEIRTRYAQAYTCADAIRGWWKIDRPEGPGPDSTIGAVVVRG